MAATQATGLTRGVNVFVLFSHLAIAGIAAFATELSHLLPLPLYARIGILLVYVLIAWWVYSWLQALEQKREKTEVDVERSRMLSEIEKWRRFHMLSSHVLSALNEFLKSRFKVNRSLIRKIEALKIGGGLTVETLVSLLEEANAKLEDQVKTALAEIVSSFPQDSFKEPTEANIGAQDVFKVSFYEVMLAEDGTPVLRKRWRYYPNEATPRTKEFKVGEGAAGTA